MVLKPQVWERPPQSKSEAQGRALRARSEAQRRTWEHDSQWGEEEEPGKEHTNQQKKPQRLILLLNFAAPNQNKVLANKTEQWLKD